MYRWMLGILLLAAALGACRQQDTYHRTVARELATGVRNDSLFMGIYLGMSSKDFFTHCWELNKQHIVTNGLGNNTVMYEMPTQFGQPAEMNFYPEFFEERVYRMPVRFHYRAWAPWNRELYSDSLQPKVIRLMEQWYGPGFFEMKDPERPDRPLQIKIDGNRQITVFCSDEQYVNVNFTDLIAERQRRQTQQAANR
ncbi:MAG: hypothetical protein NW241_12440 [Bacteroidia bacterium]|nr:hypothetical protein [Bacteroidia bacterium]